MRIHEAHLYQAVSVYPRSGYITMIDEELGILGVSFTEIFPESDYNRRLLGEFHKFKAEEVTPIEKPVSLDSGVALREELKEVKSMRREIERRGVFRICDEHPMMMLVDRLLPDEPGQVIPYVGDTAPQLIVRDWDIAASARYAGMSVDEYRRHIGE